MTLRLLFSILLLPGVLLAANWEVIKIPQTESSGANSPVWLRCFVRVQDNMTVPQEKDLWRDSITLSFAGINEPFVVLLNGRQIIDSQPVGEMRKRFKVPKGILEKGAFNNLTIRLRGDTALPQAPVLAGYFDELVLTGDWERSTTGLAGEDLHSLREQPAKAFFTEKQFRRSITPLAPTENMPGERLAPKESLAKMKTSDELIVEDLLHEPLVAQPTHLSFDERGRLWVAQYRQYPYPAGVKQLSRDMFYRAVFDRVPPAPPNHDPGADRISVHADTDGDGIFDQHKTVLEGLNMANAALRGHGGIWVMHSPYLLFYPDKDGDDVPDGPPETRLAGFGLEDTHSVANGLIWGPDGWLYGGQGSTVTCRITRPGIDSANAPGHYFEGCMVWRYHPESREFEIFAEGGGNTFGLEFDAMGRLYSGHNGGDTRGWHFVQSGIYLKQGKDPGKFGPPTNPYALGEFQMMKSVNPIPRFTHNIIVADGTAMPAGLRGKLLGADPLHRKITISEMVPEGPTIATKDTGVALSSEDIAFRPVYLTNAPDGSVYIGDFYEEFIAHGQNYQGQLDPTTGRVYRLRGKETPLAKDTNLADLKTDQLIATLSHANRWHRHTAVRLLGERRDPATPAKLRALLEKKSATPALEALWALHQAGALDEATALKVLAHSSPHLRAWAIRLVGDGRSLPPAFLAATQKLLETETDPTVRSQVASTARRIPADQALTLIRGLVSRDVDAADPFIPLLCWWTLESHLGGGDREKVLALFHEPAFWSHRLVEQHLAHRLAHRLASPATRTELLALTKLFTHAPATGQKQLVAGFEEAFKGRALPPMPEELLSALAQAGVSSTEFLVRRGDADAVDKALGTIADPKRTPADRLRMMRAVGEAKTPLAWKPLLQVARADADVAIRRGALNALLNFDDATIGKEIGEAFAEMPPGARSAAITLLASREAWQPALVPLLERGTLLATEVPIEVGERLRSTRNQRFLDLLPVAGESTKGTNERIEQIKVALRQGVGDTYAGEKIYEQRCAACHQLFHKGGRIGPNLTAYQRDELTTMLSSIVTPNAEIREGYENVSVSTKDGRVLGGFIADKDAKIVVLRGFDGQDTAVAQEEIAEVKSAGRSLMPEGLLDGLTDQQLRDFFAYLRIPQPISK